MKLIIAEKNDAARQIAERLSTGKPKKDKVYNTAIYRFEWKGEECVTIGLAGHILAPDFCDSVLFDKKLGWYSVTEDGEMLPADMPDGLARPPYDTKRKPFLAAGISIKGWKLESLPYLTWAPVIKLPAEKELIRSLKNLAKKSDSVIIATDFDREGELIGSDALNKVREVAPDLPVARAQYSSFTKAEITQAFDNLVSLDQNLADAGESRQHIDLIWGAVLTRYLTLAKFGGFGNVRSAGRVQTPTLSMLVERQKQISGFKKEKYFNVVLDCDGLIVEKKKIFDVEEAERVWKTCQGSDAIVEKVESKEKTVKPPKLYDLTTLQREANRIYGMTAQQTLNAAQSLYEQKLITYPRTDSQYLTSDMEETAKQVIRKIHEKYQLMGPFDQPKTPEVKKVLNNKKVSDHHAIIPTVELAEFDFTKLREWEQKILFLIAVHTVEAMEEDHVFMETEEEVRCQDEYLKQKEK